VLTERNEANREHVKGLDWSGAESLFFTGRAVAALAGDERVLDRTGEALISRELADDYGFTDLGGKLPKGPMRHRPKGLGD